MVPDTTNARFSMIGSARRTLISAPLAVAAIGFVVGCQTTGPPTAQVEFGDRPTIDDQVMSAEQIAAQIASDLDTRLLPLLDERYTYDMYIAPFRNLDPRTSTSEYDLVMRRIRRGLMTNPTFMDTFELFEAPARMADIAAAQRVAGTTINEGSVFEGRGTDPNYILVLSGTATPIRRADGALYDLEVNVTRLSDGRILYVGDYAVQYGRGAQ